MPKLHSVTSLLIAALSSVMLGHADEAGSGTEHKIAQLERQVATLREAYALARADADEARRQLREIRARLEALGGTALGDSEEKLIETIAQLEAANAETELLKQAALNLAAAIESYTRGALVEDAVAKQGLDAALRELDVALGLRQAQPDELSGNMHEATILSIDSESGLIVINAGRAADIQVGMPMQITRGDQVIARAIVTDVRKKVAGLLVQKHVNASLSVEVGDRVSVTTND
ncbi:MAG: hypothetical protein Q4A24_01235 [Akkermansia sp.]|nr:hypothetical protein [Akkermansia sp.]MDO4750703.1 hypothetical protein [Akkermansia sp.]